MPILFSLFLSTLCLCFCLRAESISSSTLLLEILQSMTFSVSGNPGLLSITLDGQNQVEVSDSSTTYTAIANLKKLEGSVKITGAFAYGGTLPEGLDLLISLSSSDGVSLGLKSLSSTPVDLVTNLSGKIKERKQPITYTFRVTDPSRVVNQTLTRTVVLTVVSES